MRTSRRRCCRNPATSLPVRQRRKRADRIPPCASISLDIDQRILSLDIPAADYASLAAGPRGYGLLRRADHRRARSRRNAAAALSTQGTRGSALPRRHSLLHALGRSKEAPLLGRRGARRWGVVATDEPARVGDGPVNVAQVETWVDPHAEWAEIFRETWRNAARLLL